MSRKHEKWTPQRLNKASDELEREETSLGSVARAIGTTRQNLCNKALALQKRLDSGDHLIASERRFLDNVTRLRQNLPVQFRTTGPKGETRLAKGSQIGDASTSPEKQREIKALDAIQLGRVNALDPAVLAAEKIFVEDAVKKWEADREANNGRILFTEQDIEIMGQVNKTSSNMQKNLPKNIDAKADINIGINLQSMSDEQIQAERAKLRADREAFQRQEAEAKKLRAPVIEAEFRDVEVANANA